MYYDDYDSREDWEVEISNIVEDLIDVRNKEIISENIILSKQISEERTNVKELKKELEDTRGQLETIKGMKSFLSMVDENNIFNLIESLGIEKTLSKNDIRGMDSERIEPELQTILLYYDNRELIFDIFDLFDIKYNISLRDFKLPRDYSKEEISDILKQVDGKMLNTNGCYFKDNFGFWLGGSFGNSDGRVPLQEVFKNPHIKSLLDIIEGHLDGYSSMHYSYLFEVTKYQDLTDNDIFRLAEYLPDDPERMRSYHKSFIDRHKEWLFVHKPFYERYFKYANGSRYGTFPISYFEKDAQIEYLEGLTIQGAIEVMKDMKYSEDDMVEVIQLISTSKGKQ